MFPSLTFPRQQLPVRRVVPALLGAVLLLGALAVRETAPQPQVRAASLSETLAPATWALVIPTSWLAIPVSAVRPEDRVDLLAVRPGDRVAGYAVATDLRVMGADERSLVVQIDESSATAVAIAHAGSWLLVPLIQSTR